MACRGCSSGDGCECSLVGSADGVITFSGDGTPATNPYTPTFNGDLWLGDQTVDDATACGDLNDPHVPVLLGTGDVVMVPLPCISINDIALPGDAFAFTYSGDTDTSVDPGDAGLRLNSADYSLVTEIAVSEVEINGTVVYDWLGSLANSTSPDKGRVRLYSRSDPTKWADYTISAVGLASPFVVLTVSYNGSNGAFTNDLGDTVLDFTPSGSAGFESLQNLKTVTDTYIFELADRGYLVTGNKATGFAMTVPPQVDVTWLAGTHISIFQLGAGQITVTAGAGVTILGTPGLKISGQYGGAELVRSATVDTWYLTGDLAA